MPKIDLELVAEHTAFHEFCRRYWQLAEDGKFTESVAALAAEAAVSPAEFTAMVSVSCTAYVTNRVCSSCGQMMTVRNRTEYLQGARGPWQCLDCEVETHEATQKEKQTQQQARLTEQERGVQLLEAELAAARRHARPIEDLSFTELVYLVSVLRLGGSEDLSYVMPCEVFPSKLSPTTDLDKEILTHLYHHNLLVVHPGSRPEAIKIEGGEFASYFPFKVHWTLPLADKGASPARYLEDLEAMLASGEWPDGWRQEANELHRQVALHECLEYLRLQMEAHQFTLKVGDKTRLVLKTALQNFSVAQVYNFIYGAVKDASSFLLREQTTKPHAANIVPGAIQRRAERCLAENTPVKAFRRDFNLPQTSVSQVLLTMSLKLPDGGFTTVPPKEETSARNAG